MIFVHVRLKRGHIPRSICYPSTEWQLAQPRPASAILIVIGRDEMAAKAAELLAASKCRHVLILSGYWRPTIS